MRARVSQAPNEEFLVDAFVKGLRANSFNESLVKILTLSLSEIRLGATTHIKVEDVMRQKRWQEKRTISDSKSRDTRHTYDDTFVKRSDKRYSLYVAHTSVARQSCRT